MLLLSWLACTAPTTPRAPAVLDLDPPTAEGALAPALAADDVGAWLAWIEPSTTGQQLRVAALAEHGWDEGVTVADGPSLLAHWADPPQIARGVDGELVIAYPVSSAVRGYDLHLARSVDGAAWLRIGPAHADGTATEHGYASIVPTAEGIDLLWLDGRDAATGGATGLRRARIGDADHEELVDERVCDCCSTDAVALGETVAVAYRDRTEDERRDIRVALRTPAGWRTTEVSEDGWQVGGCPVNGPAIAAAGDGLAVAWYTGEPAPEVRLSWSFDGGASFEPAYALDVASAAATPLGRVDLVTVDEDVVVTWIRTDGDDAAVMAQRVDPSGRAGRPVQVVSTRAANLSGFPRAGRTDAGLLVTWAEAGPPSRVRARAVPLALLGAPTEQARRVTATAVAAPLPDALPPVRVRDASGRPVALAPSDRPTLIALWAPWCAPCLAELPRLAHLARTWGDEVRFVGLVVDDLPERASVAADEAGVGFPQRFVDAATARQAFGSPQVPATYLFDGRGRLVWSTRSVLGEADPGLDAALRRATGHARP